MGWIAWIVFGLIAGLLAQFLMPGKIVGGLIATIILGIVGAFVGGWIGTQLNWGTVTEFDLRSMALAVLGGVVVLFLYGLFMRARA
jgi:uncharacterized membrane protein YeaQ/YmgE (transglycosylase-associated protein family)